MDSIAANGKHSKLLYKLFNELQHFNELQFYLRIVEKWEKLGIFTAAINFWINSFFQNFFKLKGFGFRQGYKSEILNLKSHKVELRRPKIMQLMFNLNKWQEPIENKSSIPHILAASTKL